MDAGKQLLLIADDAQVQESITAHYQTLNYQVVTGNSVGQIEQLLSNDQASLALFHVCKDNPSRNKLLDHILQNKDYIPVIMLTYVNTALEVTQLLRRGITAVFRLPLEPVDMQALDNCIARHSRHTQLFVENQNIRQQLEQSNQKLHDSLAELKRDQEAGRRIQHRLMPSESVYESGLKIERYTKPSLYLSGDFVDHMFLPDGQLLFYLADVSGHGASSALLTVLLKMLVQNTLSKDRASLADDERPRVSKQVDILTLMTKLNVDILDYNLDKHLTMFMGLISSDKKQLSYVVAGHYPMPILCQNGHVNYLQGLGSSFPIGLFGEIEFQLLSHELSADFSLLLCSDGVLEMMPNSAEVDQETMLLTCVKDNGCHIQGLRVGLQLDQRQQIPDDIAIVNIAGAKVVGEELKEVMNV